MKSILTTIPNARNWLLTKPYAAIDTEFKNNYENESKPYTMFAASIVDNKGFAQFRHISDFRGPQPEKDLVKWLMGQMLGFRLTIGWYSKGIKITREDGTVDGKDSDLKVIDSICKYYNTPSIIQFNLIGVPYVSGYDSELCKSTQRCAMWNRFRKYYHVDLYQVYKKPVVKSIIYDNKYRSLKLDTVCQALIGEGKLEGLDGSEVQRLSKEKQLEYVSQDTRLVMKLSQHNNYEILDLMNAISTIIGVPFERVCHTGISTWWKKIIEDKIIYDECKSPTTDIKKRRYTGGYVIDPNVGFYEKQPVYVLDVKSLYPSMMIANNISFDTVNCNCCSSDLEAKVDDEIMDILNSSLPEEEKREHYWICRNPNYKGIVPRLLQQYRDERFRQQELGNESMQLALKNLINGCYGIFGTDFFPFADYRVAELTTAYGRQTLQYMHHVAKEVYDFSVIYGDTDSIFATDVKKENDIMKFIAECSISLDIDVEESHIYKKFLITKKKHYIGISTDVKREPDIIGMEGIKSDRPPWINKIERQFVDDIKNGKDVAVNIRNQYKEMESGQVALDELLVKHTLQKDPNEYPKNRVQRVVGTELHSSQGDTIRYYKSDIVSGGGTSNPSLLSRRKYLEMLRTTVEDSLKIMGYDYMKDIVGCKKLDDSSK
jgi:DNA polymerase I